MFYLEILLIKLNTGKEENNTDCSNKDDKIPTLYSLAEAQKIIWHAQDWVLLIGLFSGESEHEPGLLGKWVYPSGTVRKHPGVSFTGEAVRTGPADNSWQV